MKIGTIGTGFIVDRFLSAIGEIEDVSCVAMYTRNYDNAKVLADTYGIDTIHTNIDAFFNDNTIDVIYIASPNSLHYKYASEALKHGKHVICEKPLTSTVKEAEALIQLARDQKLMLFEAITTIHLPNYQLAKAQLHKLGHIKMIQCNYGKYSSRYDALLRGESPNVFNPKFSGGALADINIYNLHFVLSLFGEPRDVQYMANKHANGIDTSGILTLQYDDFLATCVGSKDTNGIDFIQIQGEEGFMQIENGANAFDKVTLHLKDGQYELNNQLTDNLLYYETVNFKEIYDQGDYKQCYDLLTHSLAVMRTFEQARQTAGIVFASDQQ